MPTTDGGETGGIELGALSVMPSDRGYPMWRPLLNRELGGNVPLWAVHQAGKGMGARLQADQATVDGLTRRHKGPCQELILVLL